MLSLGRRSVTSEAIVEYFGRQEGVEPSDGGDDL